jgi:hypothetical protein
LEGLEGLEAFLCFFTSVPVIALWEPSRWERRSRVGRDAVAANATPKVARRATVVEVMEAVRKGAREHAKRGREVRRYNFTFARTWQGEPYAIKQVAPVVKEEAHEIVVITVYTFYF